MTGFEDLGVSPGTATAAGRMGWTEPTPVQIASIPPGLAGRDLVVKAQTGTGKTGAYSLIVLGATSAGGKAPASIVLTPTRELAMQVEGEMRKLSKSTGHTCVAVYGGADIRRQADALRRGTDVVVGTPGRTLDLAERGALDLSAVSIAILDEADRMLDMGFEEDLNRILDLLPHERQTLFFSATMAPRVERLAELMTRDAEAVDVSSDSPVTGLTKQYYVLCKREEKRGLLSDILSKGNPKSIVFCATRSMVDSLFQEMRGDRRVGTLHGDMPQSLRERVTEGFRENRVLILIATDVAARGLDVSDIDLVVNFDSPKDPETYLHRIGRTGRAGREGVSVSLITNRERGLIPLYEEETGMRMRKVGVEGIGPFEAEHLVMRCGRAGASPAGKVERGTASLSVSIGKANGVNRTQIADFVRSRAGLGEDEVGKVGLGETESFVEIPADSADAIVEAMDGSLFGGIPVKAGRAPKKKRYSEKIKEKERLCCSERRGKSLMRRTCSSAPTAIIGATTRGWETPRRRRGTSSLPSTTGQRRSTASTTTAPSISEGSATPSSGRLSPASWRWQRTERCRPPTSSATWRWNFG